jgi:regulatory protein
MKITLLVLKNNRVQVFIDEEYAFSCTPNFVAGNRLYKDLELNEQEFEALKKRAQYSIIEFKLFEYAMRGRNSEFELKTKVSQYCMRRFDFKPDDDFLNTAIEKAKKIRLYNSNTVINNLAQLYLSKSKSKRFIYSKLISKRFNKEEIVEAIESLNEDKLDENLKKILGRKYDSLSRTESDRYKLKQKLIQFALGRGYPYKEIKEVVGEIMKL